MLRFLETLVGVATMLGVICLLIKMADIGQLSAFWGNALLVLPCGAAAVGTVRLLIMALKFCVGEEP